MGYEAERMADNFDGYFEGLEHRERQWAVEEAVDMMRKMPDDKLLGFIIKQGKRLNTLATFKTYDIAKKLRDKGWTPSPKQRDSLINTAARALNTY